MLFEDDDKHGRYEGTETSVDTMSWSGTAYTLTNGTAGYVIPNTGTTDFIMVVTLASDAVPDKDLRFSFESSNDISIVGTDGDPTISPIPFAGNQTFTIQKILGAGPPLPPCLPDESGDACNLVEGVPPLPPCLPNGDGAACNPIEGVPPLPPCLPDESPNSCGG